MNEPKKEPPIFAKLREVRAVFDAAVETRDFEAAGSARDDLYVHALEAIASGCSGPRAQQIAKLALEAEAIKIPWR